MQAKTRASLKVFATPTHLIVPVTQFQSPAAGTSSQLVIECKSLQSRNMSNFNPFEQGAKCSDIRVYEAFGFLGLLKVNDRASFALIISKTRSVGFFGPHEFFQVMKTTFVPAGVFELTDEIQRQISDLKKVSFTQTFEGGFYYSRTYDLTQSLQKQHELNVGSFLHDHADSKFYWNKELYGDLLQHGVDHKWFLPLIEGYVGIRKVEIAGVEILCGLISRRACSTAHSRGLDEYGEVGNFVETEQLLLTPNGTYFGLTLVRGSVPVFWELTGPTSRFTLTKSSEDTSPIFTDHIETLLKAYQKVLLVNLLSTSKPHERVLSEAYKEQIRRLNNRFEDSVAYLAYPFDEETQISLDDFLAQASPMLLCHLYFSMQKKEILAWQKGVCRFNCLDCLDRTNAVMSRVGWFMLAWQMRAMGRQLDIAYDRTDIPGLEVFKALWADNGDALSLQYAIGGGNILQRGEKTGLFTLQNSTRRLDRLYATNYEDHRRSDGFETLLGKFVLGSLTKTIQTQYIQRQVALRESEFLEEVDGYMRVVTWNVCGQRPPSSDLMASVLFTEGVEPNVVVLGLQDLVPSNASRQFQSTKNLGVIEAWVQLVTVTFTRHCREKYTLLKTDLQVGVLTLVYVQTTLAGNISSIDIDKVKSTTTSGIVAIRFNLHHTSICLCNVNLPMESLETRLALLEEAETQAFQSETANKKKGHKVSSHEIVVLFGGLNCPLTCSAVEAGEIFRDKGLPGLITVDQLTSLITNSAKPLSGFKEAEINFPPTFNSASLQQTEPELPPSWSDRILYNSARVTVESYASIPLTSERLPVRADLLLRLRKVNDELRQRVEKEEAAKATHMDMSLSLELDTHRRAASHNG